VKIKGAVVREAGKPYCIEELELDAPKEKEAFVRYVYSGYCHSDLSDQRGRIPMEMPVAAGHECAGVVEEVGPGCTRVKKGDHVVGTWVAPCGECTMCRTGNTVQCTGTSKYFMEGMMLDGTSRIRDKNGRMVRHGLFVSAFSNYSVVPEVALVPIRKDFPLEYACLMGCSFPTGWGAVTNAAKVRPGESVAIWGMGGVGLNILRAAVLHFANPVIAVDLEESKRDLAMEFGATHFICNADEDPVPKIQELTGGGVDVAFEAVGDPGAIVQAYWATGPMGKVCVTGITPFDTTTNIATTWMPFSQKSVFGQLYGKITTYVDIPKYVDMAMTHDLKLDKLVTKKFKLEEINDVAEKMEKRQTRGRWLLAWD